MFNNIGSIQYAAHQTNSEKVLFLFKVYDIDGKLARFINKLFW